VFQETFLFSATLAENIALGRPDASRAEIEGAARAARADGFIRELPLGYDTVIGERGISLSGGQRQRIAIARALLIDPRILLLDDATSAVDPSTEQEIREAMRELCRGRTTFVVAQRAATVRTADQILVLQEGRLVAQGRHESLMSDCPVYRDLFADTPSGSPAP
jgi:ATP-binding cassette subfamily B protein